jgi:hypothetical protein
MPRASARSSAARPRRVGERRRLEVARRQRGDRVEREQVGERAELAVLRRRRAERARAQVARGGEHGARVGRGTFVAADRDRLEQLRAEHGAEPAATGVAAVVRQRRVLTRRSPAGPIDATRHALPRRARRRCSARRRAAPEVVGRARAAAVAVDEQDRRLLAGAAHDDRVVAGELAAMAKWLEASASLSSPVSGDFATTANFALVVSGVPTSGEKQNASGASGPSGSTRGARARA